MTKADDMPKTFEAGVDLYSGQAPCADLSRVQQTAIFWTESSSVFIKLFVILAINKLFICKYKEYFMNF